MAQFVFIAVAPLARVDLDLARKVYAFARRTKHERGEKKKSLWLDKEHAVCLCVVNNGTARESENVTSQRNSGGAAHKNTTLSPKCRHKKFFTLTRRVRVAR